MSQCVWLHVFQSWCRCVLYICMCVSALCPGLGYVRTQDVEAKNHICFILCVCYLLLLCASVSLLVGAISFHSLIKLTQNMDSYYSVKTWAVSGVWGCRVVCGLSLDIIYRKSFCHHISKRRGGSCYHWLQCHWYQYLLLSGLNCWRNWGRGGQTGR